MIIDHIGFETLNYVKNRYKKNVLKKLMRTMIIHSNNDELIDIKYAKELSNYADEFYIAEGTHSNINIDNDLIYKLLKFIAD